MLSVFKKYQGNFIICLCVAAVFAFAFIYDGAPPGKAAIVFLVLGLLSFLVWEAAAGLMHRRLLTLLYNQQRPKEFIAAYTPLTQQSHVRKNVLFSMKAYLSNAHAALGNFSAALQILDEMPQLPPKREAAGRALISGNRCNFYLDSGQTENALQMYETFLQFKGSTRGNLRRELEATDALLKLKIAVAQGQCGKDEEDAGREILKSCVSPLHKTQLQLLLGQIYSQTGRHDIAGEYFKSAAKSDSSLWAVKQAKAELKQI